MPTPIVNDILSEIASDYMDYMFNAGHVAEWEDNAFLPAVQATYAECVERGWSTDMAIIETSRLHHSTFHLANNWGKW